MQGPVSPGEKEDGRRAEVSDLIFGPAGLARMRPLLGVEVEKQPL
jgi:hypothetical protein